MECRLPAAIFYRCILNLRGGGGRIGGVFNGVGFTDQTYPYIGQDGGPVCKERTIKMPWNGLKTCCPGLP
jgi:hypothetical protein